MIMVMLWWPEHGYQPALNVEYYSIHKVVEEVLLANKINVAILNGYIG